ncbi:MAG: chemotaxis protein CheA [bacterium]|nr:chemotaxis protein CheA [bacterium]
MLDEVVHHDGPRVPDKRQQVGALGKILDTAANPQDQDALALQVASVLDPDLIASALGLALDHVTLLRDRVEVSTERLQEATSKKASGSAEAAAGDAKEPQSAAGGDGGDGAGKAKASPGDAKKPAAKKVEAAETVRVSVDLLDTLMTLAREPVLGRTQLLARLDEHEDPGIKGVLQNIDIVTSDLQSNIMNTRMQPVGNVFKKYHRVVRDLSRKLGKKVDLEIEGSDVELDKSIIELLSDPLTHLVRNSLDHGMEAPAKRAELGKPETGRINLAAYHEGGQVNIEIRDNGRGIDPVKTRQAAVERELMSAEEAEALSDADAVVLIFAAGFSLAAEVTEVSGRGVGMDVVKANITKLGGKIDVESEVGVGTVVRIRLPLTLAIVPSLIVVVDEERFAVPQVNLVEIVRVKASEAAGRFEQIKGADVLRLRGQLLPLVRLADALEIPRRYSCSDTGEMKAERRGRLSDRRSPESDQEPEGEQTREGGDRRDLENQSAIHVVVLRAGEHQYGLIVDRIADSEEIVVKPLSAFVKGCRCYAGATIMGDGRVAMILDVAGIATETNLRFHDLAEESDRRERSVEEDSLDRRELILFANAEAEQFAVDLGQIVRLEKVQSSDIEVIGGTEYMQHLGKGLPLIRLENEISVGQISECDEFYVLIPNANGSAGGILASRVIDTIDTEVAIDHSQDDPVCVSGRALIEGRLTTILDAEKLLTSALGELT